MTFLDVLLSRARVHTAGILGLVVACVAGYKTRYLLLESGEQLTKAGVLFDDAFFYTTLTRNFVKLGFLTLDGQTPTNGVQPLWQAMLIAVHWLAPSWELVKVNVVLSFLLYAGFCGLTSAWLCRVCSARASLPLAVAVGVALTASPFFSAVLKGLETPLFLLMFSVWLWAQELLRCWRDEGRAREWHYAGFGLVCALLFLARTDWFLASIASFVWLCLANRPYAHGRLQLPALRVLAAFSLPLVALVLPYVVHNWVVHGHPMPISGRVKLHYMKEALPTLDAYLASEEWRGAFALLQQVFRLPSKGKAIGIGTWILWATALGVGAGAFRKLHWARLGLATIFAHWVFMQFAYRELRPYTRYYFAVEVLTVCVLLGGLANVVVGQVLAAKVRMATAAGLALVFATVWVATDRVKNVRATARWETRLQLARDLAKLPASAKIGAFWPGVFAYYSNRSVFPLDGIIGSESYFKNVVKRRRELEYAQEHDIEYIVAEFPLKAILGRREPRSGTWDKSARKRLWAACRYVRSTKYRRGAWSVFSLGKHPVASDQQCPGRR